MCVTETGPTMVPVNGAQCQRANRTFVGSTNDAFDECTLLTLFGVLTTLAPGALSAGRFSVGPVLELLFRRFSGRDLYLSRFWPK